MRVKRKLHLSKQNRVLSGLRESNSEEIKKEPAVNVLFKCRHPVDLKLAWLNPANLHEFRLFRGDVDIRIPTGEFDEKISLFLSVETLFGSAGRENVAVRPLGFDDSVMRWRPERLLPSIREKALLGQFRIFWYPPCGNCQAPATLERSPIRIFPSALLIMAPTFER